MSRKTLRTATLALVLAIPVASTAPAASVELHAVQFPERATVSVPFLATAAAPAARMSAEVTYRQGQARIEIDFDDMKPAILFGGDVTCYVVWAVTRDGQAENLGELVTRKADDRLTFSTGKKAFALLVTAESYYLVAEPSGLVVFRNRPLAQDVAVNAPFEFTGLVAPPDHGMDAIAHIRWDSRVPLELLQARKAFELATRNDAETHAPAIWTDASEALAAADSIARDSPRSRELLDNARRAVALSNEALNISRHRLESIEVEKRLAERRAETEALEQRAAEAEAAAAAARRLAEQARAEVEAVRIEKERTAAETAMLRGEKSELEGSMLALREEKLALQDEARRLHQDKLALERESERLLREKEELKGRLQAALSHVAETRDSVRGFVVNLPDILFDVDQATLKPDARVALAKLAGILLIVGGQDALVEGHTDATGSAEYNLDLSQRRADAVVRFLHAQGVDASRLRAMGYGMERPVADNATPEGRSRNRRVEIVIREQSDPGVEVTRAR